MSNEVFSRVPSVFFVHPDSHAGEGGGCTLQFVLDNGGFADFDHHLIMAEDGAAIGYSSEATYNKDTGVITEENPNDFEKAQVGMVIKLNDAGYDEPLWARHEED